MPVIPRTSKLTKKLLDKQKPSAGDDYRIWDTELKGFGVRIKGSGVITFFAQFTSPETGKKTRATIGQYGRVTPDEARGGAKRIFGRVAAGVDPVRERNRARLEATANGITVAEFCDEYIADARAGKVLYRGRPKGALTIDYDVGRIQRHIKPLIGSMLVGAATQDDIIHLYNDIRLGKTATTEKTKPRGVARVKGGETAATRTLGSLGSIFSYAVKRRLRIDNPCRGVERASDGRRDRILTPIEYRALADAFTQLESNGANPTAIAAYRALMCSGYRKSEIFGLKPTAVDYHRHCIRLDSSKSGQQVRAMGITALRVIESAAKARKSQYVFPAKVGEGHVTDVRLFSKAVKVAGLDGITLHALRHSFASVALELEYSELTIAAMLGHRVSSVTSRYAHTVDRVVIAAADRVSQEIASRMLGDGGETAKVIDLAPGRKIVSK